MIKKAYFEITNVCNMNCTFCPGTNRSKGFISTGDFEAVARKLSGRIPYLYLHLMGEPTIHPALTEILKIAGELGFKIIITTNGTTLAAKKNILLGSDAIHKISISVHSFEANSGLSSMDKYLHECFEFCRCAADKGIISVMRLWNLDGDETVGENTYNPEILDRMRQYFGDNWVESRSGMRLADKVFLEYGEKFEWPDPDKIPELSDEDDSKYFCHGLRDHIGILWNGDVVPCCLDGEGTIVLGNLLKSSLEEILESDMAKQFYNSFSARKAPHPLCRTCGYAKRFAK